MFSLVVVVYSFVYHVLSYRSYNYLAFFHFNIIVSEAKSLFLQKAAPAFQLKVVIKSGNRLPSLFRFKYVFPKSLISGTIYKYQCAKCKLSYIGSTFRYFEKRLEEHVHVLAFYRKTLVRSHTLATNETCQNL